jgi:hypothetical protein
MFFARIVRNLCVLCAKRRGCSIEVAGRVCCDLSVLREPTKEINNFPKFSVKAWNGGATPPLPHTLP